MRWVTKMLLRKCVKFSVDTLKKCYSTEASMTALYNFHVQHEGKMVNFGGFMLPVQYKDMSITSSHLHTRKHASLFDVSHMLQTEIIGKDCLEFFETICTANLHDLNKGFGALTVFTNENGGILDDLIVSKLDDDHIYIVSNAAMKKEDQKIMLNALDKFKIAKPRSKLNLRFFEPTERSLLALQGPEAAECLQKITDLDLSKLYFMSSNRATIAGVEACRITRCGYTGEDGFEISIPACKSEDIAEALMQIESVRLAGLGARDSLRLEAGLCLYGSDITTETTPVEAGLSWLVAKTRREKGNFPGAKTIKSQLETGPTKKRVGLISKSGPPARHDTTIYNLSAEPIGVVTSGCPSPSLGTNISMGYVPADFSKPGTQVLFKIRDKMFNAIVTKMPFVKANYFMKPK